MGDHSTLNLNVKLDPPYKILNNFLSYIQNCGEFEDLKLVHIRKKERKKESENFTILLFFFNFNFKVQLLSVKKIVIILKKKKKKREREREKEKKNEIFNNFSQFIIFQII